MPARTRTPLLTGGCQCGAVRYALYAAPERVHLCHCRMCQRATGGPFAALAPVRRADMDWTRGAPSERRSSAHAARGFCAACGTPLSFRHLDGDWIDVTIGSLDDPDAVAPRFNYGVESRVAWLRRIDALPDRETGPGGVTGGGEDA
ncbi:MAG: GFA family protein [Alphaproteobacteria bacterium]|nr:GFA family protein [Alphaproteobacteria bacterium]